MTIFVLLECATFICGPVLTIKFLLYIMFWLLALLLFLKLVERLIEWLFGGDDDLDPHDPDYRPRQSPGA